MPHRLLAYRTASAALFGAAARPLLVQVLGINPEAVGKGITLLTDADTGFLHFRLQAAYDKPYYRTEPTHAAAAAALKSMIAHFHHRQTTFAPRLDLTLPPLFADYLKLESLTPVYYTPLAGGAPILHYWQAHFLPRLLPTPQQKRHSLDANYTPSLSQHAEKGAVAQREAMLESEYVTMHFADGRVMGLDYNHLPVLAANGREEVQGYAALLGALPTAETATEHKAEAPLARVVGKATDGADGAAKVPAAPAVLLYKRKHDLLVPFVRLADGQELPACVEAEGVAKGVKKSISLKTGNEQKFIEGSTIYFVFVNKDIDMQNIVNAANYILKVNNLHTQIVGIDWSDKKLKKGMEHFRIPSPTDKYAYIGTYKSSEYFDLDHKVADVADGNSTSHIPFGFTPNFAKDKSYIYTDKFGISAVFKDIKTVGYRDGTRYEQMKMIEDTDYFIKGEVINKTNVFSSKNSAYDRALHIARTSLHEISHQILTKTDHSNDSSSAQYNKDIENPNKLNPNNDYKSVYERFRISFQNPDTPNVLVSGGTFTMPRYMGNVVYQNFTKWLPIDAFIINEYFTFGHDIDYIESLISLSTNLTYDIYRSLTTRASITIKDNYTLSNYEKKILPHTQ